MVCRHHHDPGLLAARAHADRDRSALDFPGSRPGAGTARPPSRRRCPAAVIRCGRTSAASCSRCVAIASLSIVAGLVVTHVLLRVHGVAGDDESFIRFLARHRSSGLTDASLVGSIMAGGVVLPIVAGVAAVVAAAAKHWRLAGFLLFALAVESASYRTTTLVVHRHRPDVHRLEQLPVNASYPSGHTAARSPSTAGSRCSSPRGSSTARRGSRSGSSQRSIPVYRRLLADVSRHAPPDRRRGRRDRRRRRALRRSSSSPRAAGSASR